MFSPPLMIMSFIRSSTWTYPSASARPTSPVRSQPSARNVSAVASGRFQYPPVTTGPLTQSSPTISGSGASCIVPPTATATLTPGTGCPTVHGRSSQSRPTAQVTIEVASVRPQTLAKVTPGSRLTAFVRNASATGAPPKQTVRSAGRSAGSKAGSDSISWIIAVTPAKKVHLLRRRDRDDPADAVRSRLRSGGPARAAHGLLRRRAGGRGVPDEGGQAAARRYF